MESGFRQGFQHFDEVRAKYRNEPWYKDVHGNYTYLLLPYTGAELRDKGRAYVFGTPFRYDPMPTPRALNTPQLWVLGADDLQAPSEETSRRIRSLAAEGRPITLAVYPGAEHGMIRASSPGQVQRTEPRWRANAAHDRRFRVPKRPCRTVI